MKRKVVVTVVAATMLFVPMIVPAPAAWADQADFSRILKSGRDAGMKFKLGAFEESGSGIKIQGITVYLNDPSEQGVLGVAGLCAAEGGRATIAKGGVGESGEATQIGWNVKCAWLIYPN